MKHRDSLGHLAVLAMGLTFAVFPGCSPAESPPASVVSLRRVRNRVPKWSTGKLRSRQRKPVLYFVTPTLRFGR